jgi:transposase
MEYEQRVTIKCLVNDGLSTDEIEGKLKTQFAEDVYSLRTTQFWIPEVKRGREDLHNGRRPWQPPAAYLMRRIQEVLDYSPIASARSIAERLQVSHATMLKHLHEDLEFRCFYLRWVPLLLTPELKEQRR